MSINNPSLNCPSDSDICRVKKHYDLTYQLYKDVKYGDDYKKMGKSIEIKTLQQDNSRDRDDALEEKSSGMILKYLNGFYFYFKWLVVIAYIYILYKEYGRIKTYSMKGSIFYHVMILIFIVICLAN